MAGEDDGTHQTFSLDADKVAVASLAPGSVDHVTKVIAVAVSDRDADQPTLVVSCAHNVNVTGYDLLTLHRAVASDVYISKCLVPSRSNLHFLISDIRALWRSFLSARVPECQKLKM